MPRQPRPRGTPRRLSPAALALFRSSLLVAAILAPSACTSGGIAIREGLGIPKRQQLVDRVEEARDAQAVARDQFVSARDQLVTLAGTRDSDLEQAFSRLRRENERSRDRAASVRERIAKVESVADAMFREWEGELAEYRSADVRRASERTLADTRVRYARLADAMQAAQARMQPVLDAFNDQVLFLKHNLNARAIASLQGTVSAIDVDITALIRDLEKSVAEADAFVREMAAEPGAG